MKLDVCDMEKIRLAAMLQEELKAHRDDWCGLL